MVDRRNPIIEAAMRAPLSAVNLVCVVVGGCGVYYTLTSRVEAQAIALARLEQQVSSDKAISSSNIRELGKDLNDLKVVVREVATNTQWLVRNTEPRAGALRP